jgi:predicted  nucleic acid-binding Zn-ribbon protein
MIAETAYFRAERRGFNGDPVADWIEAEAEVDAEIRRLEREHVLERLEHAVATATKTLDGLKKKVSKMTAAARAEWEEDAEKLKAQRDALRKKLTELRELGEAGGHKAKEQGEKLRDDIRELVERLGAKIRVDGWNRRSTTTEHRSPRE